MNKKIIIVSIVLGICLIVEAFVIFNSNKASVSTIKVDLTNLTYGDEELKSYSQDEFSTFLSDYESGNLPSIYVTNFIFDGVGMYKTYDLDDFIDIW